MPATSHHDSGTPCWADIIVSSQEQHHDLRAFLSAIYGWEWQLGDAETGYYSMALVNGAPVFGVGIGDGASPKPTIYFATNDIEKSLITAEKNGATVVMPATQVMSAGTMAILVDPLGATFGLWRAGDFPGFGVVYEINTPGWFDHVSDDPDAAGAFYGTLTGHTYTTLDDSIRILQNGDQWFASLSHPQVGTDPRWNPIFVTDSLQRIRDAVPRHGGTILIEEMPVPGSAICVFTEPINGTVMTVMQAGEYPS
jgi:predicted enzyme related to lactoylglutathione lyase